MPDPLTRASSSVCDGAVAVGHYLSTHRYQPLATLSSCALGSPHICVSGCQMPLPPGPMSVRHEANARPASDARIAPSGPPGQANPGAGPCRLARKNARIAARFPTGGPSPSGITTYSGMPGASGTGAGVGAGFNCSAAAVRAACQPSGRRPISSSKSPSGTSASSFKSICTSFGRYVSQNPTEDKSGRGVKFHRVLHQNLLIGGHTPTDLGFYRGPGPGTSLSPGHFWSGSRQGGRFRAP
jgi:hypothetical protein